MRQVISDRQGGSERKANWEREKRGSGVVISMRPRLILVLAEVTSQSSLACYDTVCHPGERFSPAHPFSFHPPLPPFFLPDSRLLHPFCPCHNFISSHVISKLVPNEFLISLNSVAVVITFIVFSFTITHIRGRVVRV